MMKVGIGFSFAAFGLGNITLKPDQTVIWGMFSLFSSHEKCMLPKAKTPFIEPHATPLGYT